MKLQPFKLERYFAAHEFKTRYFLSGSDCEPLSLQELLALGDADSLRLWENLTLGYTESAGHPLLRQEIAQLYQKVQADDVLVVTPEEGIFITMNTLLSAGDHVIAAFPGYQSLYEVARAIGCQVTLWTPQEGTEWRFDLAWLKEQINLIIGAMARSLPISPRVSIACLRASFPHRSLSRVSSSGPTAASPIRANARVASWRTSRL